MNCKICNTKSQSIFKKKILGKYDINYYQCSSCNFIQTEDPFWLEEAYGSAINYTDIGLVSRNILYTEEVTAMLRMCNFDRNKRYLDYGGGYGLFVRMMRDNGFNFYWSDDYCENIFVKKFSADNLSKEDRHFEVLTAFEVFEHLVDPIKEIEKMLDLSGSILFSTELTKGTLQEIENWWYLGLDHGQHVALYNKQTLEYICKKYNLNLHSRKSLHFISKKKINDIVFKISATYPVARLYNTIKPPKSLLQSDFEFYKQGK
jgi:2-polyprenyl-3-methyl-5-hydroxy-6-metoxy-1,4-benzoquinol methylase